MGVYKRGKTWYIDYYDQYGKRHREAVGSNKRLAEQVLAKRKTQVAEGKFLDVKKRKKTKFEDMAKLYLENYAKHNKKSWKRDETCIKNLMPHFKGKYLDEISPLDIENYKKMRIAKVTPRTVNIEVKFLKAMYNKAISWGKADKNPVNQVKLFKENDKRIRYLEKDEIKRLIEACPEHLRPIVITALNTGMRKQEILKLKWEDIDFKKKIIYVMQTKTGERREIPVNDFLYDTLTALKKKRNGSYVFSNKEGEPYGDIRRSFSTALKRAGIENFRFHDLRHTFASHLVMSGVDLKTVQELMGHKTIDMTLRYAHLSPDHKRKAVENLGSEMQKLVTIWSQDENLINS